MGWWVRAKQRATQEDGLRACASDTAPSSGAAFPKLLENLVMADRLAGQDASILSLRCLTRIEGGNKRSHKRLSERMPKLPPDGSEPLFVGFWAPSVVHQVAGKLILGGYASTAPIRPLRRSWRASQ